MALSMTTFGKVVCGPQPSGGWKFGRVEDFHMKLKACPFCGRKPPPSDQILARIEILMLTGLFNDTSIIFSVQRGGVYWVRTVTKDMKHIEGESKTLLGAFKILLDKAE